MRKAGPGRCPTAGGWAVSDRPADLASLPERLAAFVRGLNVELEGELGDDTALITSGLLDSLALLSLAAWIEREISAQVDFMEFDLATEWDSISTIASFIERHRT